MGFINSPMPMQGKSDKESVNNLYDAYIGLRRELEYLLTHLDKSNIPDYRGINGWKMFNGSGINPRFLKAFPNKIRNSSFEVFATTTSIPTYWTAGVSTNTAAFDGTYSLKLTAAQTSRSTGYTLNPQWWITVTGGTDDITKTRVSFYQKLGSVKIEVLNVSSGDAAFTLTDEDGNSATSITYPAVDNWGPASLRTITFPHGSSTSMSVRFTNMEVTDACYIDAVIVEPDFTGEWASFYTHGPNSLANTGGKDITVQGQIYVQDDAPTEAVVDDVWIDTNDYSRFDVTTLTTGTTLSTSSNEVILVNGTFDLTLHAGTAAGIIKYVYNIGSGTVKIIGTINGYTDGYLPPNSSVQLITDGTNWRY